MHAHLTTQTLSNILTLTHTQTARRPYQVSAHLQRADSMSSREGTLEKARTIARTRTEEDRKPACTTCSSMMHYSRATSMHWCSTFANNFEKDITHLDAFGSGTMVCTFPCWHCRLAAALPHALPPLCNPLCPCTLEGLTLFPFSFVTLALALYPRPPDPFTTRGAQS